MAVLTSSLGAQEADEAVARAAATITTDDVARQLRILNADSLRDRTTPGPALERTAQYVAAELQRFGLQPGVWDARRSASAWSQRYPVPGQRQVDMERSWLRLVAPLQQHGQPVVDETGEQRARHARVNLVTEAHFAPEIDSQVIAPSTLNPFAIRGLSDLGSSVVVVAGHQTVASIRRAAARLRERVVLYVPPAGLEPRLQRQLLDELYAASQGVVAVSHADSAGFAGAPAASQRPVAMVEASLRAATGPRRWPWAVWVRAAAIEGVCNVVGVDLARLITDTVPVVQELSSDVIVIGLNAVGAIAAEPVTAPNVAGLLVGRDSVLKHEYLVIAAHMDDRGRPAGKPASPPADAADNTAGVASLLAVARAFSQPGLQPRRSVVFLLTSGGAQEFWGAHYFAADPPLPEQQRRSALAANLTLDLAGRLTEDTIWIDGLQDVELAMAPAWVAGAHPELALTVADGGTAVRPRAEHFPFVQAGVPSLYVHGAGDRDGPSPGPGTAMAAADIVRAARFVFYLSQAIATADQLPRWTADGRQHLNEVVLP